MPMIVGVHPSVPAKNMREFVEHAKKAPKKLTFGSSSPGATSHVAAELLMQNAGFEMIHIPYKGGGPALTALLAGEIDLLFNDVTTLEPHINAGKVRALGASSAVRLPSMPNLPTIAEAGVAGFEVSTTNAIFVPKGTPAAVVERFRTALVAVLSDPAMVQDLLRRGMLVQHSTPAELNAMMRKEQQMWRALLQSRKITLDQ
jgi:tripartite-type tricarboxylate transporter receptor subunit TctC